MLYFKVDLTRNLVDMKFGLGHLIIAAFRCITLQFGYSHMCFVCWGQGAFEKFYSLPVPDLTPRRLSEVRALNS